MTKTKKIQMLLLAIALFVSCFFTCFASTTNVAYASSIGVVGGYTNVLDDLQQDVTFNASDYVVNKDDLTLQVITIAESNDNELFVYVYQPSGDYLDFRATSINISTAIGQQLNFRNYKLSFLNKSGVFYKYVVKGLSIKSDLVRFYEISSIYRDWYAEFDEDVDKETDNSIDEIAFAVGKQFKFTTNEMGGIALSVEDVETIKVTDKFVGYIRYTNGYVWFMSYCNAYYVAFSTDKEIDTLLEADVFYTQQEYTISKLFGVEVNTSWREPVEKYAYLKYSDVAHNQGTGIFGQDESWERIQDIDTFIAEEDLTDETKENLQGLKWVLRFGETEILKSPITNGSQSENGHIATDVSILRLAFITDGVYYNLGVVDNKQTGSLEPTNNLIDERLKLILAVLFLIILLIVLAPILPTIFSILWSVIKFILKILFKIISLPFKGLRLLFRSKKT